jgi:16S rRNA processing protein RimM
VATPPDAPAGEAEVILGTIAGVFGFRGEVRLILHHREGGTLSEERPVILVGPEGQRREVRLRARAGAGKRVLGRISGVDSEEGARALMDWQVVIRRADMPPPAEGEYYVHDLFDLPVFDETGAERGVLADVVPGDLDVWVVAPPEGDDLFLVARKEAIVSVDVAGRRIVVRADALTTGE